MQGPIDGVNGKPGVGHVDAQGASSVRRVDLNTAAAKGGAGKPAEAGNAASISGTGVPSAQVGQALLGMMAGQVKPFSRNFSSSDVANKKLGADHLSENAAHPALVQLDALFGEGQGAQAKFQALVDQASRLDETSLKTTGLSLEQLKAEEVSHNHVELANEKFMAQMRELIAGADREKPTTAKLIAEFHDFEE